VEEGAVGAEKVFMSDHQASRLSQPRIDSLDDPPALVPPVYVCHGSGVVCCFSGSAQSI
jgi:hypothetical protein